MTEVVSGSVAKNNSAGGGRVTRLFKWLLVLFSIIIVVGIVIAGAARIQAERKLSGPVNASKTFVSDLKNKSYNQAYNLVSSEYKKTFKATDLQSIANVPLFKVALAGSQKVSSKKLSSQGDYAYVTLRFSTSSGSIPLYFTLHKESGQWLIASVTTQ